MIAENLNIFCLCRNDDIRQVVNDVARKYPKMVVQTSHGSLKAIDVAALQKVEGAEVVVVDVDADSSDEIAHLRRIVDLTRGKASVLATSRDIGAISARELIRQGIHDYLPQPFTSDDLSEAIESAWQRTRLKRADGKVGKVIAVSRAKGGMGATTTAIHMALSLIRKKKRKKPGVNVCLLDLDLQFGDAGLYLDLERKNSLIDIANEPERIDLALFSSFLQEHKSGLSVLTSPADPMPMDAIMPESIQRIVDFARESFDYVVIDLPLAMASWQEPVFARSDAFVLVSQLNVPAVLQTRRYLDILRDEGLFNLPVKIALNRYVWRMSEAGLKKRCVRALGQPINMYIPNDHKSLLRAMNQGVSVFDSNRGSAYAKSMKKLTLKFEQDMIRREKELAEKAAEREQG